MVDSLTIVTLLNSAKHGAGVDTALPARDQVLMPRRTRVTCPLALVTTHAVHLALATEQLQKAKKMNVTCWHSRIPTRAEPRRLTEAAKWSECKQQPEASLPVDG